MPNVTVAGLEYGSEDLSDNAKAKFANLQILEQ